MVLRRRKPSEDSDQSRLVDEPEYEFEAIVTNDIVTSDEKKSALDVFKAYNHGVDVENRIREPLAPGERGAFRVEGDRAQSHEPVQEAGPAHQASGRRN